MDIENLSQEIKEDVFKLITNKIKRENNYNQFLFSYGSGKRGYTFTAPMLMAGYNKSIKTLREEDIGKGNKPVAQMQKILDTFSIINIREVVVLIDVILWKQICDKNGLTENWIKTEALKIPTMNKDMLIRLKAFRNKKHLRFDWLLPDYHIDLEHDGSLHTPLMDTIRDEYIKSCFPDIRIKRLENYNPKRELEFRNYLKSILSEDKKPPMILRYENYVWECYLGKYSMALYLIDLWHNKNGVDYENIYDQIRGKYPDEEKNIQRVLEDLKSLKSL